MEEFDISSKVILDELDMPVLITDIDTFEILFMNRACMKLNKVENYYGKTCHELLEGQSVPCSFCKNSGLFEGRTRQLEQYNVKLGKNLRCIDNIVVFSGHHAKITWILDITEQVKRETELKAILATERLVILTIQTVCGTGTIGDRLDRCLKLCGEYYDADRCYICPVSEDGTNDTHGTYEWYSPAIRSKDGLCHGADIRLIDNWMPGFKKKKALVVSDVRKIQKNKPEEYSIMTANGIGSYIVAPMYCDGRLIGLFGVDNPRRNIIGKTADLLLSLAYAAGNSIERWNNEQEILNHRDELEQVINNIPVGVSMIRVRDGKAVSKIINPLLREQYGISDLQSGDTDNIAMSRLSGYDKVNMMKKMRSLLIPGTEVSYDFHYRRNENELPRSYQMRARSVKAGDETLLFSCLMDRTQERNAEVMSAKNQKIYEVAAELGHLKIWVYDVGRHRITLSDNSAAVKDIETYGIPIILENVPDSLESFVDAEYMDEIRKMYKALDDGVASYECEYRYKSKPGIPEHYERIRCTMTYDDYGKPLLAYAVGIDITTEHQEREEYRRTVQTLMTTNPDSLGCFRINLSRNTFVSGTSRVDFTYNYLTTETADEFFERAATLITDDEIRKDYKRRFSRKALLESAKNGDTRLSVEYRSRHNEEDKPWVRAYFSLIKNPDSGDIECFTYANDITHQVLRDSIFKIISDQEYDYVALLHVKSQRFEFVHLSSNLLDKYHRSLRNPPDLFRYEDIRQFAIGSFIADEDRDIYLKESTISNIVLNLEKKKSFDINLRGHYTGHPNEFMYRKIEHYYLDDEKDTILLFQLDVTETVVMQQKEAAMIKVEAEHVKDIIDSMGMGVAVHRMPDENHVDVEFVNDRMLRIFGLKTPSSPEARRKMQNAPAVIRYTSDAFGSIHPDDAERVKKAYHDGFNSLKFSCGNYRIVQTDGNIIWVNTECTLREIRPDGHIFYSTYRVVDHEVELENSLKKQLDKEKLLRVAADSANAAKSDFLSRMSHDIRTPLNGIIGMTYLTQEMDLPEEARDNLRKIDLSSKFLLSLINEVLDMTKAESGKIELRPEPYRIQDFQAYLSSVILPLCKEKNIRFVLDVEPLTDYIPMMDSLRLNQVFFNLLSNAVKFTPEGGSVTFRLREHLTAQGRLALEITVADTGIGMSEDFQKHLFEPFTQEMRDDSSEMRGTGLGLAIVKKLLDLMDCSVNVKSYLGKGTSFAITGEFDCITSQEAVSVSLNNAPSSSLPENCHVLLCEDHPLNQEIVKRLLTENNALVNIAEDGRRGLNEFATSPYGFYDIVLMDVRMPIMDGIEATRHIRRLNRDDARTVPIIAMTADAFDEDVRKCLDAGMNGHIAKPIDPESLCETVREYIMKRRT